MSTDSRGTSGGWRGRAHKVSHSLVSLYTTFFLAFFDPVQRSRIDTTTFLVSSGPECRINQCTELAIVRSSCSFADRPAQFCYQRVSRIDIAHIVVPKQKAFEC